MSHASRLANLLAATARLVDDAVDARLAAALSLTASAPAALVTIAHYPGQSVDDLRRTLDLTHSGAVRLVDRLEADELVRRRQHGRSVSLELTPRGRRVHAELEQARLAAVEDALAALTPEARAQLEPVLEQLLAAHSTSSGALRRICRLCAYEACERPGCACPVAAALD
jgi:MarR family transcriptional regulator, negative regulator of the multidrug operon emrRAB